MSFLSNLINNAANSMSEGIKKRVEDGTFNRLASDFGRDINSLGAGMVSIVSMAENAFGKLKDKAADAKAGFEQLAAERQQADEERRAAEEQERVERLAAMKAPSPEGETEGAQHSAPSKTVTPTDEQIARLAEVFDLNDEDVRMYSMVRLTVQTALFFANCDGDYTKKERSCVDAFKDMIYENFEEFVVEDENGDKHEFELEMLFDGIERRYTIDEIVTMTHRLVDGLSEDDRQTALESIDYLAKQIVEAEKRDDERTEFFYNKWRNEFGI